MYKDTLRRKYRYIRDNISAEARESAEAAIKDKVLAMEEFISCDTLFTFVSTGSEVSTGEIAKTALGMGKGIAAPVVTGKRKMDFIFISSLDELHPGAYGILEPVYSEDRVAVPTDQSLMLVPGFAFDLALNRLGYGGGFYDKYMSEYPLGCRVGLAFHCQYTQFLLPNDSYDVPLDILITERMIKRGVRK